MGGWADGDPGLLGRLSCTQQKQRSPTRVGHVMNETTPKYRVLRSAFAPYEWQTHLLRLTMRSLLRRMMSARTSLGADMQIVV